MGGKESTKGSEFNWSQGTSHQEPWSVQTPYIKSAFERAENAYNKTMAEGPYQGDYVATGDQKNTDAFNQAFQFGTDPTNLGYVQHQMDSANRWMDQGGQWAQQGAEGLRDLSGDQTQNIINSAGQYADNPYISAAVRSAMYDANRQASESTIPNMYRAAAGANALNSDRAALGQGLVERGLAEQAGNLSADMRYKAWDRGLSTAQDELNARRSGYGTLAGLGQAQMGLGMQGLEGGLANQQTLNRMSIGGAEGLRGLRQDALNNDMAKWEGKSNFPWAALNNFYSIIGSNNWGGETSWSQFGGRQYEQETKKTPSVASIMGGALGGFGSLLGHGGGGGGLLGFFQ